MCCEWTQGRCFTSAWITFRSKEQRGASHSLIKFRAEIWWSVYFWVSGVLRRMLSKSESTSEGLNSGLTGAHWVKGHYDRLPATGENHTDWIYSQNNREREKSHFLLMGLLPEPDFLNRKNCPIFTAIKHRKCQVYCHSWVLPWFVDKVREKLSNTHPWEKELCLLYWMCTNIIS